MNTTIESRLIRTDSIDVPPEYERSASLVEDDALRKSIEANGIQQPLNVFAKPDGRYALIKGGRRLAIAQTIGLRTVPAVVDAFPEGVDPREYQDRLRFILDECRQDLFPSQRAELINKLMSMFDMTQKEVAAYLGVDAGTITNYLAINKYAPVIVKDIDQGRTTLFHARTFDGLKPEAQVRIYRKHRGEMERMSGGKFHKLIRSKYSPKTHSEYYVAPEKTAEKLQRQQKGRKSRKRPKLSRDEKQVLAHDLDVQETELRDSQAELKQLKREIALATPPIRAILRSDTLTKMLSKDVKEEFGRFAEVYI